MTVGQSGGGLSKSRRWLLEAGNVESESVRPTQTLPWRSIFGRLVRGFLAGALSGFGVGIFILAYYYFYAHPLKIVAVLWIIYGIPMLSVMGGMLKLISAGVERIWRSRRPNLPRRWWISIPLSILNGALVGALLGCLLGALLPSSSPQPYYGALQFAGLLGLLGLFTASISVAWRALICAVESNKVTNKAKETAPEDV